MYQILLLLAELLKGQNFLDYRTWGNLGKVNCGNPDFTLALVSLCNGSFIATGTRANVTGMSTKATHSFSICPQLKRKKDIP